jgi:ligand-binding sensor domain-containing protein
MKKHQPVKHITIAFSLFISTPAWVQELWQQTNGPYQGGAVHALAIDSSGYVFAGTKLGGVFRSADHGANWVQVNNDLPNEIMCLLANKAGAIFAGTNGFGIFRSIDKGATWKRVNNGLTQTFVGALGTTSHGDIFAGTYDFESGGIFRTTDNGEKWVRVFTSLSFREVSSLAIHANGAIFAGSGAGGGIYRSPNNGESWILLRTGFENHRVSTLAINSIGSIFAATSSGGDGGIFVSTDDGENWGKASSLSGNSLVFDSKDEIFLGGIGVYRSKDSGTSWIGFNTGLFDRQVLSLVFDEEGHLLAGTEFGGVFRTLAPTTSVKEPSASLPLSFALGQNYPNPFNPTTTIAFVLPRPGFVTLKILDVSGTEVATPVSENLIAGRHEVQWHASNMASGMYFYRLQMAGWTQTRKLVVAK